MALSNKTQDHDVIREWAEKRGARPAEVASTERKGQTGILRLEFPGAPNAKDDSLKEIEWEEFFEKFDRNGLEFIYQEQTAEGAQSNFNKLIHPEHEKSTLKKTASKKSAGKSASKTSPAKTAASKSAASKTAAKKTADKTPFKTATKAVSTAASTPASKTAGKASSKAAFKAPAKSASTKQATSAPERNYPKPEHGGGNSQVF